MRDRIHVCTSNTKFLSSRPIRFNQIIVTPVQRTDINIVVAKKKQLLLLRASNEIRIRGEGADQFFFPMAPKSHVKLVPRGKGAFSICQNLLGPLLWSSGGSGSGHCSSTVARAAGAPSRKLLHLVLLGRWFLREKEPVGSLLQGRTVPQRRAGVAGADAKQALLSDHMCPTSYNPSKRIKQIRSSWCQFSSQNFVKFFKILRHIKSLDACMKH